jgi:hypothetical protein
LERPLIFDFCTPRRSDDAKTIYYYDFDKNLNMVNLNGQAIPFVDYGIDVVEMITKTFTHREADDDNKILFEFDTITKVDREENDEDNRMMSGVFEFETSTRVFREGSDLDLNIGLFELMTKTDVVRERDDD